jgi:DNA primase
MAGRIPQSFIQDLLARTDIVQLIGERLQLKKAGKEYVALSPFSNEKTPSFTVSPQKQFYHCFSSGKHGTVISFLMEYDRLSFVEAVEELARRAGLQVPREGGSAPQALVLEGPLDALAAAERFYRAELKKSQIAIDYLKRRGVSGETAKRFGLGFAPESWDALAKQFPDPKHALTAGLLICKDNGSTYDRFRNRVMFPIRDTRGRVIAFGGRALGDDKAKYLNSPETPLFHKGRNLYGLYEARQGPGDIPFLLVVEGYMDAVMLAQHGLSHVVATLGTATTREHLNLLYKSTARVVFCFDGDRAGRAAAWRALEQALAEVYEGRECLFMFLPEGHDPDSLVQDIGADAFRERIAAASPLSKFLVDELSRQVNLATPDGRAKLAALARPHLARMREGPLRSLILDDLVRLTRLTRADLDAVAATGVPPARPSADGEGGGGVAIELARPVRGALRLLLEQPALARTANPEDLAQVDLPGVALLREALEFLREHPDASPARLLEHWRDSEFEGTVNRLAASRVEGQTEGLEREFFDAMKHLQRQGLRARAQTLLVQARQRELTETERRELDRLSRELAGHPARQDAV